MDDQVGDGSTDGNVERRRTGVRDDVAQRDERQAARLGIGRNQGIEGFQPNLGGNVRVGEQDLREGIGRQELALAKS